MRRTPGASSSHDRSHRRAPGPSSAPREDAVLRGKKRFRDHEEAVDFLHHAATARARAVEDDVETTHRAVRSYECAGCHGVHVTSLATWGPV